MASSTLREAAQSLAQFYNLLNDVYTLHANMVNNRFEIRMQPLGPTRSAFLERLTLATICWHARWLSRRADLKFDAQLAFPAQPDELRLAHDKTFGGQVVFDAPASFLHSAADYETLPVSRGDHGVQDTLRAQLMAEMALLHDSSASFVHKIERILKPRLGQVNIANNVLEQVQI